MAWLKQTDWRTQTGNSGDEGVPSNSTPSLMGASRQHARFLRLTMMETLWTSMMRDTHNCSSGTISFPVSKVVIWPWAGQRRIAKGGVLSSILTLFVHMTCFKRTSGLCRRSFATFWCGIVNCGENAGKVFFWWLSHEAHNCAGVTAQQNSTPALKSLLAFSLHCSRRQMSNQTASKTRDSRLAGWSREATSFCTCSLRPWTNTPWQYLSFHWESTVSVHRWVGGRR